MQAKSRIFCWLAPYVCAVAVLSAAPGCHQPEHWCYTGPRVYLIEGTPDERSDALPAIARELHCQEINAQVYSPDNWLKIVVDIDAKPDEEVILVGHGHGAFLATQVVRHYAQCQKMKHIDAVFTIDAYNKDWPHNAHERGDDDPHEQPMPIPIGHNAVKVRNYVQQNPDSARWGSDLVSTRASNIAEEHPYYWYDDYWNRRAVSSLRDLPPDSPRMGRRGSRRAERHEVTGEHLAYDLTSLGVTHETIDNHDRLVQRIVRLCRKAALSPYHYTPPEHHVDVAPKARPIPTPTGPGKTTALGPAA